MRIYLLVFTALIAYSGKLVANTEDHPLLERYPGFSLMKKQSQEHSQFIFPLAPPLNNESFSKQYKKEGALERLAYEQAAGAGAIQVMRNYEKALQDAGAKIEFSCINQECIGQDDYHPLHVFGHHGANIVSHENQKFGLLTASLNQQGNQYWVAVIAGQFKDYTRYELVILEEDTMALGKLSVKDISQGIENQGRVVLKGIHFDTGKATIKDSSKESLSSIAAYLNSNSNINAYVVGHTDYTGSLSLNISLSEQRAQAVVKALVEMGISQKRLIAKGVGPLSPIAVNKKEKGRAQNRRVELVLSQPHK